MTAVSELVPVPEREMLLLLDRCFPLLPIGFKVATDMLPLALPLPWGAKVTDKPAICCGARVMGKVEPAKLNPVPVTVACAMVRFVLPVLVSATDTVLLLPIWTLPKLRLEEERASWPVAALE